MQGADDSQESLTINWGTRSSWSLTGIRLYDSTSSSALSGMSRSSDSWGSSMSGSSSTKAGMPRHGSVVSSMSSSAKTTTGSNSDMLSARAEFEMQSDHWTRSACYEIITTPTFNTGILLVIAINTCCLAIQTTPSINQNFAWYLGLLDQIFLGIFIMEMLLKLWVYRIAYFKAGWNVLDFAIVIASLAVFLLPNVMNVAINFNPKVVRLFRVFRAFRAIRSLRALRAISFLKHLQIVVEALLKSLPALSSITALSGLVLYIFSVIGRTLFGSMDHHRFGNMGSAMFWLFSAVTLDNWTDMWHQNNNNPGIFLFLCIFVILESFILLNLIVAVICSNLDDARERMIKLRKRDRRHDKRESRAKKAAEAAEKGQGSLGSLDAANTGAMGGASSAAELEEASTAAQAFAIDAEAGIDNYYPAVMNLREKTLFADLFQLMASLDHSIAYYDRQVHIINSLVDMLPGGSADGVGGGGTSTDGGSGIANDNTSAGSHSDLNASTIAPRILKYS